MQGMVMFSIFMKLLTIFKCSTISKSLTVDCVFKIPFICNDGVVGMKNYKNNNQAKDIMRKKNHKKCKPKFNHD
jgi:hypothetical protein